jgi:hypothetical protein
MKNASVFLVSFLSMALNIKAQVNIPSLSPAGSVQQQVGLCKVTINYGRPSLKGRKMLGQESIPYGNVWRLGANEVTTLELTDTVLIQGKSLPKGKYAMLAIPGEKEWTIIINSDANQWGAYTYNQAKDVFRFSVAAKKLEEPIETLLFVFDNIEPTKTSIVFKWENIEFAIGLVHESDAKVMADIKDKTSRESIGFMTLLESAEYYLLMNRDLDQAMVWITQALEKRKSPFTYNVKAQIAQKQGNCTVAIEAAKGAIEYAQKNGDIAAKTVAENIIKSCDQKNIK